MAQHEEWISYAKNEDSTNRQRDPQSVRNIVNPLSATVATKNREKTETIFINENTGVLIIKSLATIREPFYICSENAVGLSREGDRLTTLVPIGGVETVPDSETRLTPRVSESDL